MRKVLHIDVDSAEIDKNIKTDAHIIGDAKAVLDELTQGSSSKQKYIPEWMKEIAEWKAELSS